MVEHVFRMPSGCIALVFGTEIPREDPGGEDMNADSPRLELLRDRPEGATIPQILDELG